MKEFVEKLIGRFEEEKEFYRKIRKNTHCRRTEMDDCDSCRADHYLNARLNCVDNLMSIVNELAEEYNNGWIAFKQREMTEEEKEVYGEDLEYMLDCKLPDDDEEIIVCYKNGYVDTDTFIRDTDGCYLDSGNDFIDDVIAWMPLPAPYQKGE